MGLGVIERDLLTPSGMVVHEDDCEIDGRKSPPTRGTPGRSNLKIQTVQSREEPNLRHVVDTG
jgi:hypothetical protein